MTHEVTVERTAATIAAGRATVRGVVATPEQRHEIWYSLPERWAPMLTTRSDPLVLSGAFLAMNAGGRLRVKGRVTQKLLENLESFSVVWNMWRPGTYHALRISAETVDDELVHGDSIHRSGYVQAFSGGVDATTTLFRHTRGDLGRRTKRIRAALMIHGFDIPLDQDATFDQAVKRAGAICQDAGVELIPLRTNLKALPMNWEDSHHLLIASCLTLLGEGFEGGIIANSLSYLDVMWLNERPPFGGYANRQDPQRRALSAARPVGQLLLNGSNPITDAFVGSDYFPVNTDGAELDRVQKLDLLRHWPAALKHIRVCWEGAQADRNCGRCEKCVRTQLGLLCVGVANAPCFPEGFGVGHIIGVHMPSGRKMVVFEEILEYAAANGRLSEWWAVALARRIRNDRNVIRQFVRRRWRAVRSGRK